MNTKHDIDCPLEGKMKTIILNMTKALMYRLLDACFRPFFLVL